MGNFNYVNMFAKPTDTDYGDVSQTSKKESEMEVKKPIITLEQDKHNKKEFFLLPSSTDFVMILGKKTTKRIGPKLVVVTHRGIKTTIKSHKIDDQTVWKNISELANLGTWASNNKQVAPVIPEKFLKLSKRFQNHSLEQRKDMADRMQKINQLDN